jgi:cytochrome b subunit of formate dehydrogenase/cytochrome c1
MSGLARNLLWTGLLLVVCNTLTTATLFAADKNESDTKNISIPLDVVIQVDEQTLNVDCLECHGVKGFAVPVTKEGEGLKRKLYVDEFELHNSVHTKQNCVDCHNTIKQIPHQAKIALAKPRVVECVTCHEKQAIKQITQAREKIQPQVDLSHAMVGLPPGLITTEPGTLKRESDFYLLSVHAKPRKNDPDRPNAGCGDCHGTHNVLPMNFNGEKIEKSVNGEKNTSAETYRLNTPEICGACHEKELKAYTNSVHGAAVKRFGKLDAAVCGDCHSAHQIASPKDDPVKLAITKNCGSCHDAEVKSYRATYHGQVAQLGYAHTAKCADCHAPHNTLAKKNPKAQIHSNNLVATCKECHKQATVSFVKFQPHGNTHEFDRFPEMWIVSKFMIALLAAVFLLFWSHSIFWFLREKKEHPGTSGIMKHEVIAGERYVRRFSAPVRIAHLLLAIAVMTLALTGTTVLYAESFWAPTVMSLLGGAKIAAIIHRIAATLFGILFFGHILSVFYRRAKRPADQKFRWFGPESLLPNKRDWQDIKAMKDWFAGKAKRPDFERWTYWEKFDYWAPFWGMFIIGVSGLTLWFSPFFGSFLPGWIFNVATIVHGEEAFLAIVFLFTVHFFNSHFRPDKFPLDIIMFTGSMPLHEFKKERTDEYARLLEEGTFDDYLVDAPSESLVRRSRILGFTLIGVGLFILVLVLLGFIQSLLS